MDRVKRARYPVIKSKIHNIHFHLKQNENIKEIACVWNSGQNEDVILEFIR